MWQVQVMLNRPKGASYPSDRIRIASFLDKSVTWIEEIIRFVPSMDSRLRNLLEEGRVSWNKAKSICRQILSAPPDKEKELADKLIEAVSKNEGNITKKRLLSPQKAIKRLTKQFEKDPKTRYTVDIEDLLSLFVLLSGKDSSESHIERVRKTFPGLVD